MSRDRRVTDGRTAVVAQSLEDRLAVVDRQLQLVDFMDQRARPQEALRLWRERYLANRDAIGGLGFDETFHRMWEFYLATPRPDSGRDTSTCGS